jgi:hypothetical protein
MAELRATALLGAALLAAGAVAAAPAPGVATAPGTAAAPPVTAEAAFPDVPDCAVRRADRRAPGRVPARSGYSAPDVPPAPRELPSDSRDLHVMTWTGLDADPVTPDIPFIVREGTVGITIRAEAEEATELLVSVELLAPDGTLIACDDCPDAPAVGEARAGRGTTQMPSTDRPGWELGAGRYAFRVRVLPPPPPARALDEAVVDVLATFRTERAVTVEHLLDLNFVYLPGSTLTKEIATTDPHFAELLQTIDAYLAPTGIQLGTITHVDLDRPEFSTIATWDEVGEMFRTSSEVGRPRALNVYCIQKFVDPLNPVVGLSGGEPGPLQNGTVDSGIAIRMSPFFTCPDCLPSFGSLFAHEIGHYLGFYHTSETDLESWDPFADTPECHDLPDLRACPDWSYVMFPVIHAANVLWSPDQIRVAATHPLVRSVPVVGPSPALAAVGTGKGPLLTLVPNPFRDTVRIDWAPAPGETRARVRVHDVTGRLVRTLEGGPGVSWDGRDGAGRPVAPGTYFVRLETGRSERTGRIVHLP